MAFQQGDQDEAIVLYTEAARLFSLTHQPNASVLNNLAIVYRKQEKYDKAIELYNQSIQIKLSQGDTLGAANSYMNLALLYSKLDLSAQALDAANRAIIIYKRLDLDSYTAWAELSLGDIFFDLDKLDEADSHFQEALRYYSQHQHESYYYHTLHSLGKLAAKKQSWPEAEQYYTQALGLARKKEQLEDIHLIARGLSQVLFKQGKRASAFRLLDEALALKDTLVKQNRLELMEEMQARFELVKKTISYASRNWKLSEGR